MLLGWLIVPSRYRVPMLPCTFRVTMYARVSCVLLIKYFYTDFLRFLEILYSHKPGIRITRGYQKTCRDPGTRFSSSESPRVWGSDPTRQTGRTRLRIPARYPGNSNQAPTSSPVQHPCNTVPETSVGSVQHPYNTRTICELCKCITIPETSVSAAKKKKKLPELL